MKLSCGLHPTASVVDNARGAEFSEQGADKFVYCPLGRDIPRELERLAAVFRP